MSIVQCLKNVVDTCVYRRSQIKVSMKEMFDRSKTALIRFIEQCFIIGNFICHLFDVGSTGLGGSASQQPTDIPSPVSGVIVSSSRKRAMSAFLVCHPPEKDMEPSQPSPATGGEMT